MLRDAMGMAGVRTGILIGAAVVIAASLFVLLGPMDLLAKSDKPAFCVGCHVMEAQYEAWFHAGAHRRIKCVDCHLPHENIAAHYVWKSIDGVKDAVVFYSGSVPDEIALSAHGEGVLQANCVRCHEQTVAMIDKERRCWDCHRRITHTRTGAMATL